MAKYRKKPVIIDAWQLTKENIEAGIPDWIDTEQVSIFGEENAFAEIYLFELTLHVNYGDYIIKGVQGEFYPCKPDIFEATYVEAVSVSNIEEDLSVLPDFDLAKKCHIARSCLHKLELETYRRTLLRQVEGKGVEFGKSVVTVEGMRGEFFVPAMEEQLSRYGYVQTPMIALQKITAKGEVSNKLQYIHQVRPSPDVTVIGEYDFGKKAGVKYNE
jgi:hypothetical protein